MFLGEGGIKAELVCQLVTPPPLRNDQQWFIL